MSIFKANDIRGIYNKELNPENIYKIGFMLPEILSADRILVGWDSRLSSIEIYKQLAGGIRDAGADVIEIGFCDTPAVYFATFHYDIPGSVMITASHNPPEDNGLKISGRKAVPIGPESGLKEIESGLKNSYIPVPSPGKIVPLDIRTDYIEHIRKFMSKSLSLTAVFDCSNGAASAYSRDIFLPVMKNTQFLFDLPDGNFPNHGPNPLEVGSWKAIQAAVVENKANLGVLFDGDADRAIFFDENGEFISPDVITALLGYYFYEVKKESGPMFHDIRSSKSVSEYINSLGAESRICKTGHARIKKILKDFGGVYAGELSGHYYFRDNGFCDSAYIATALILEILNKISKPFSEIVNEINPYSFSGEINFKVNDQSSVLDKITESYKKGKISYDDGVRIDFDTWWFILRPSGAEPVLRLVVEADEKNEMMKRVEEITKIIKSEK